MGCTHVSNDDKLEGLLLGELLGSTVGNVLGSYMGIKLGSSDGIVLGNICGNLDVSMLGIDVGRRLGPLDGSFDGSNDGLLEGCSCCRLLGPSCHWCSCYPQVCRDGRHFFHLSGLDMDGGTGNGCLLDVWRFWFPFIE